MIKCQICGRKYKQLTNTHLGLHGMIIKEYKEKFNKKHLLSNTTLEKHRENTTRRGIDHPEYGVQHSKFMEQKWEDLAYRNHQIECVIQYFKNPEVRKLHGRKVSTFYKNHPEACEKRSEVMIERWQDELYRDWYHNMMVTYHKENPQNREDTSKRMKKLWESNEYRVFISELMVELHRKNPIWRENTSKRLKMLWEDDKYREEISRMITERNLKDWQNPERGENHSDFMIKWHMENPENKELSSKRMTQWNKDHPELVEKFLGWRKNHPGLVSGENHWNWKGGYVESKKRRNMKRREMGYFPLFDNPFPEEVDVDYHHVNRMLVVPVPHVVHHKMCAAGIDTSEHRERCNLWMYYLYGIDFDLLLRS